METVYSENNMQRIRELTEEIFAFSETAHKGNGYIEFDWEVGGGYGIGLYNEVYASCLVAYIKAGSIHPVHFHEQKEIIIVIKGEIESHVEGEVRILKVGDVYERPLGIPHKNVYTEREDTIVLTIVIPQSKDFSHGK